MSTIDVMRKALEALEQPNAGLVPHDGEWRSRQSLAITALRAELERLEGVEPVAFVDRAELKNMSADFEPTISKAPVSEFDVPLYTAPIAPAIPALTDDEVIERFNQNCSAAQDMLWAYALAAERAGVQIK